VIDVASNLLGPLVVPECRRSVARGWLILVRTIVAVLLLLVLIGFWFWWDLSVQGDPGYQPPTLLRVGMLILDGMMLTTALVMAPAVMAGSLAGEKERGALGLLLTTRVNAFEIVLGRCSGKLSQLAMMLLACVPALALLSASLGFHLSSLLALVGTPLVVAFGGVGIAAAASSVSKRGRDALIAVYLFLVLALVGPALVPAGAVRDFVAPLSPYSSVAPLAWYDSSLESLRVSSVWFAMGCAGIAISAWRLRPSCLWHYSGESRSRIRRLAIPHVGDRPMLWKELFIDRVGSVGRVGRLIGLLLVLILVAAGLATAVLFMLGASPDRDPGISGWLGWLSGAIKGTGFVLACIIQCAIGLRAAVTISSERERGTWDGLLTSPLEGGEIVWGKLWGSLFALRWLFMATIWLWAVAWFCSVIAWNDVVVWTAHALIVGAFMAAIGVRSSLASATATRSMSVTIGTWLASYALASIVAVVAAALISVFILLFGLIAQQLGLLSPRSRAVGWLGFVFTISYQLSILGLFLGATSLIVSEARLRFDRVAGRMSGGEVEVALDQFLHAQPMAPVSEADLFNRPSQYAKPRAENGDDVSERAHEPAGPVVS
jgi:ABC-type transport system involved in multi-copper enzyme maturation permease subunit